MSWTLCSLRLQRAGGSLLQPALTSRPLPRQISRKYVQALGEQDAQPSNTDKALPPLPPGTASAAAASISPERLKELRRAGLAIKDTVKIGRRGAAEGLANQVRQRWNTSEVCGRPAPLLCTLSCLLASPPA
jgi:hypothetical protein